MKYWLSKTTPLASGWLIVIQLLLNARAVVEVFLSNVQAGCEPIAEDGDSKVRQRHRVAKWANLLCP